MLDVSGLRKRYGSITALDDVGFHVGRGELVGFLGPNGAGKTTTMRAIMQLVALDTGTVEWDGAPVDATVRRRFGYMPAERGMYPRMRVREHLVYYGRLSGMSAGAAAQAADRWLERLGLTKRANDDVQDLSSGNQQRVQLALALIGDPELLVLDEPFSGLDPVAVDTLRSVLLELVDGGAAMLLSSHQLDLVAGVCDTVVIVDAGRIVLQGPVDELRNAAGHRVVDVEYADHEPGAAGPGDGARWAPTVAGATVVDRRRRSLRVHVPADADPAAVLADASRAGTVRSFTFEPPDLSEVFLAAVGRTKMDVDEDGDGRLDGSSGDAQPGNGSPGDETCHDPAPAGRSSC